MISIFIFILFCLYIVLTACLSINSLLYLIGFGILTIILVVLAYYTLYIILLCLLIAIVMFEIGFFIGVYN